MNTRQPSDNGSDSLTIQEVAHALRCSARSVHRYIRRFDVPTQRVYMEFGHQIRINRADVDRIAQHLRDRLSDRMPPADTLTQPQNGNGNGGNGQYADNLSDSLSEPKPKASDQVPALPGDALQQLAETIRQAVAQGVLDGLRQGQGRGKASRWLHAVAYTLLGLTLAACFGAALMLAQRIAEFTAG